MPNSKQRLIMRYIKRYGATSIKICLNKKGGIISKDEPEGLSCSTISSKSESETSLNWLKNVVEIEGFDGLKKEGVIPNRRSLILLSKNNKKSSHDGEETPGTRQAGGLRVALIILKRVFGLEQFLLIISDNCRSTKSSIWPPLWVGALTLIEKSKAFSKWVNSLAKLFKITIFYF